MVHAFIFSSSSREDSRKGGTPLVFWWLCGLCDAMRCGIACFRACGTASASAPPWLRQSILQEIAVFRYHRFSGDHLVLRACVLASILWTYRKPLTKFRNLFEIRRLFRYPDDLTQRGDLILSRRFQNLFWIATLCSQYWIRCQWNKPLLSYGHTTPWKKESSDLRFVFCVWSYFYLFFINSLTKHGANMKRYIRRCTTMYYKIKSTR